jgi:hypothetical protein
VPGLWPAYSYHCSHPSNDGHGGQETVGERECQRPISTQRPLCPLPMILWKLGPDLRFPRDRRARLPNRRTEYRTESVRP